MKLSQINTDPVLDENWKKTLGAAALAGSLALGGCSQGAKCDSAYQRAFHSKAAETQKANMRDKAAQLKKAGRSQGEFRQGKLQLSNDRAKSNKVTSPAAADFLE